MMMNKHTLTSRATIRKICAGIFMLVMCSNARAQEAHPTAEHKINSVLYAHYTTEELDEIKASDTLKYNSLLYYYTKSFIIEPTACNDCVPQYDFSQFDVSRYEEYRQQSVRYVRHFDKYGYRLILLSIDELTYRLPIHYQR